MYCKLCSFVFLFLFCCLSSFIYGQMPGGGNIKMIEKLKDMKIGKVYGKIYDEKLKNPWNMHL
ncbi:MAG: hypothetical protein KatS3mg028_0854 [Bacteroidia bacterium]|nr:MAG: hypothetical protein KatS3mg028_0854 [Bacteroidia bacterium]